MRSLKVAAACLAVFLLGAAPAADFPGLLGQANAALEKGDFATARAKLAAADALVPVSPNVFALRALTAARSGDVDQALAVLDAYSRTGLISRVYERPGFEKVTADPRFAPIKARFEANAAPVGRIEPVFSIPETPFLAESVAWDAGRRRWLVSSVHLRKIIQVDGRGQIRPFVDAPAEGWGGVFGLALDSGRRTLWAATTFAPQTKGPREPAPPMLIPFRLKDGGNALVHPLDLERERSFGDVTLDGKGGAFVADSVAGEIWRADRKGGFTLLTAGLASPQGMVLAPGGKRLIASDYGGGLRFVDLATGAVSLVPGPPDLALVGIDGLTRDGDGLVAVQNGTNPQRIVRLTLDRNWTRITGWRVLAANLPGMREPTGGVVVGKHFVFVARSQWDAFGDDGKLKTEKPEPAMIAKLRLR